PPQRAALSVAAQHHEGQEEAPRHQEAGRLRRRHRAQAVGSQDRGAAGPQGRHQGRERGRAACEAEGSGGAVMTSLLIAEHDNKTLGAGTAKALTAAAALGGDVHILVAGAGTAAVAEAASKLEGVAKVLHADAPHLGNQLAEEVAALVM